MSSLADQVACVKREIALRVNTYPKWVRDGRMKQEIADREIAKMRDVLQTLFDAEALAKAVVGSFESQQGEALADTFCKASKFLQLP
jgi:hypothetical protein